MNCLISVIVPCYQQGCYLLEAISSLQTQSYINWEAIIVNDGSTDETDYIAKSLCAQDSRVQYVSKKNGGLSSARNAGLDIAKGQWIQFLDADDRLLPGKFEKQIAALSSLGKKAMVYSSYYFSFEENPDNLIKPEQSIEFIMKRPVLDMAMRWEHELSIPIHSPLFPAFLFSDVHIRFDEALPNHEDWDMWMKILPLMESVVLIKEELAIYRVRLDSMSRDRVAMWQGFKNAINKQKKIHSKNVDIQKGLDYLNELNDNKYGRGNRFLLRRIVNYLIYYKWPLQKALNLLYSFLSPKKPEIC